MSVLQIHVTEVSVLRLMMPTSPVLVQQDIKEDYVKKVFIKCCHLKFLSSVCLFLCVLTEISSIVYSSI